MVMSRHRLIKGLIIQLIITSCCQGFSLTSLLVSRAGADIQNLVEIAPARIPQDLDQIRSCRETAFDATRPLLNSERSFLQADAVVKDKSITCLVARERLYPWRILGTADVRKRSDGAYINNVFVRQEARGLGLGKRLLQSVEDLVAVDGMELTLKVDTSNTPAVSLYRQIGYKTPGIHFLVSQIAETTGLDLQVTMSKQLG